MVAIFAMALMVSCKTEKKVDYALLSGKITNPNGPMVVITKDRTKVKQINVAKDGTFKDTISNAKGYYTLSDGRESTPIYLENGFDINVTLDTKEFDETITYIGKGEKANNFLAQLFLDGEKLGSAKDLYALEEADFLKKVDAYKENAEKKLKELSGDFVALEKKALNYDYIVKLNQYEGYHKYLTKNKEFKVSDNFPDVLKGIDLNNEEDFKNYDSYKQLVSNAFFEKVNKEMTETKKSIQEVAVKNVKAMKDGAIKNSFVATLASLVRDGSEDSKKVYDAIMELSNDEALKTSLKKRMATLQNLAKGKASPTFENYENYKGGTSSLKDFKGKFVYVDVWATWCGPCKAEIPHLKKVEKQYHHKNIVFVSISVDKENQKEAWKTMIKDKNMGGVQLFADKDWKSDFVQGYGINGIPRFILIDPKGNIVSSDAPRPSDPKLIELFKENGI